MYEHSRTRRINVSLSQYEFEILRQHALRDTRPTRDQATHYIRQALGLTDVDGSAPVRIEQPSMGGREPPGIAQ